MILAYDADGNVHRILGYREKKDHEKISKLNLIEGYENYRIYEYETIDRVWQALDTVGTILVELDEEGEPIGIITENGDLEPPIEIPPSPRLSPVEQLGIEVSQREINEIIHGRQISDIEIRLLMGGL